MYSTTLRPLPRSKAPRPLSLLLSLCFVFLVASPVLGQNVDMGETYRSLDRQADWVTTEFPDAVATTRRAADGTLTTDLHAPDGRRLGGLVVPPEGTMTLDLPDLAWSKAQVEGPEFVPSTDWANLQILSLWRDLDAARRADGLKADASQLSWDGSLLRPWRASSLSEKIATVTGKPARVDPRGAVLEGQALASTASFRTDAGIELIAHTVRESVPEAVGKRGSTVSHATFTTELTDPTSGARVGLMRWFEDRQVLVWDFPGLTEGWVDPQRQEQAFDFAPDLAWSNVQAFGFWQAHAERALASDLHLKNTEGCDGLHWLDDTIYRPCCDDHDLCYEKNGCNASSWWVFGASWSCIKCNIQVVWCFITAGGGGGGPGGGGGGGGGGSCTVSGAEWCPAECFSCDRQTF